MVGYKAGVMEYSLTCEHIRQSFNFHYGAKELVHLKRWITGLSALPVLIFLVYMGGFPFLLLIGFVCICAQWEYNRIISNADSDFMSGVVVRWGYLTSLLLLVAAHMVGIGSVAVLLALNLVIVGVMSVFLYKTNPRVGHIIQQQVLGIIYIPYLFLYWQSSATSRRHGVHLFASCYHLCRGYQRILCRNLSGASQTQPGHQSRKNLRRRLGGLCGNLLAGSIGIVFFMPSISWGSGILFFLAAGVAGQVGDLFESEMKRSSDIKDSGGLLPGHGGFLDRIDALLFASPVAYLFKMYIF